MPGAAIIGAALNTAASRAFTLTVGGVDVIEEPATTPRYAVPMDSIVINELGVDGVSSMSFTIECTTAVPVVVGEGMEVVLDFPNASPQYRFFRGWVDHVDIENMDGNVGTRYRVMCTGIEAAVDWIVIPTDITFAAGLGVGSAVLGLVGVAVGPALSVLRAFAGGVLSSTTAGPIAGGMGSLANAVTVTAGTTLREAIRQVCAQNNSGTPLATVDFSGGLRLFRDISEITDPASATLTVDDDPPLLGIVAEDLQLGIDAAPVRGVVVKGTGVTVTVMDGSGLAGSMAVLTDSTITTSDAAAAAGTAYLLQYANKVRGQFGLSDDDNLFANRAHVYYTHLRLTDSRVGLSVLVTYNLSGFTRTFTRGGARENDIISFGGPPPSMADLTRQLTRTTLS